jgi:hypothetical protein
MNNPLPVGYNRFIKTPKYTNTGKDYEITTGKIGSVNSYINIRFLKNVLNIYGNEIRTFHELIPRSTLIKIDEELDKILAIKKVVKVGGTMNILIRDYVEEKNKRTGEHKIKKELIKKMVINSEVVEINKHDTFDFNYILTEFDLSFTQADYAAVEEDKADPGNVDTISDLLKPGEKPIKDRSIESISKYTNGLSVSGFFII